MSSGCETLRKYQSITITSVVSNETINMYEVMRWRDAPKKSCFQVRSFTCFKQCCSHPMLKRRSHGQGHRPGWTFILLALGQGDPGDHSHLRVGVFLPLSHSKVSQNHWILEWEGLIVNVHHWLWFSLESASCPNLPHLQQLLEFSPEPFHPRCSSVFLSPTSSSEI